MSISFDYQLDERKRIKWLRIIEMYNRSPGRAELRSIQLNRSEIDELLDCLSDHIKFDETGFDAARLLKPNEKQ